MEHHNEYIPLIKYNTYDKISDYEANSSINED